MAKYIGTEALLHISFSLAAFFLSIVLYVLVCALGTGQVQKNHKFRTLIITVVLGNLISMLDNIFRDADVFPTPPAIKVLLLLLVYLANILLTYYMSLYMSGFFGEFKNRITFFFINTAVMISSVIDTVAIYFAQLFGVFGPDIVDVPVWIRVILGYVYELYFLIYAITLFIMLGKKLSARARYTSVASFVVVIGSVLLELLNTFQITSGILLNYYGAVIGLYIFYIGVETPDYRNLLQSVNDLETARLAADDANRSKSAFLANMSHEIRTPINAVIGMNEMILRESDNEDIIRYARNIESAGRSLLSIINDILDLSKIEAGRMEILTASYSLSTLINDVSNMVSFKSKSKGIEFRLELNPDLPDGLLGDEVRIRQIVVNLLNNAVKYTSDGSVTLSVNGERNGNDITLIIDVIDTGSGIKEEDLPHIFEKFDRADISRNKSVEGTGLGLAITSGLLDAMGGSIKVESEYGRGSTFSVRIPQKISDGEPVGALMERTKAGGQSKKYQESFRAPEALILLVDDMIINHAVVRGLLKKTKVGMDAVGSGKDAIVMAQKNKYDLILMDYRMPEMDGEEALKHIREDDKGLNRDTPVVCLTADAVSGAKERYLSEGFSDYLTKPVEASKLERMVLKFLPEERITWRRE